MASEAMGSPERTSLLETAEKVTVMCRPYLSSCTKRTAIIILRDKVISVKKFKRGMILKKEWFVLKNMWS